jgi:hypothetical protein
MISARCCVRSTLLAATGLAVACAGPAPIAPAPPDAPAAPEAPDAPAALDVTNALLMTAHWDPIADGTYDLHERFPERLRFQPAVPQREHDAAVLRRFLPPGPVQPGDVWPIPAAAYRPLLAQFDAGVRTQASGFGMRDGGGFACLRALSPDLAEIVVRVHADFLLDGGQVVFAPAQFTGSLFVDRRDQRAVAFALALPPRNSNADLVVQTVSGGLADIVFVPRMELTGGTVPGGIRWPNEIPLERAQAALARRFYAFAAIDWLPFDRAQDEARRRGRPLHLMVLFGSLDDESC